VAKAKSATFNYLLVYFLTVSTSPLVPVGGWALVEALAKWCGPGGQSSFAAKP